MTPKASDAKRLRELVEQETERMVAFAHGYVEGAMDQQTGEYPEGDEFVERVRELYRQEYDSLEGKL